jgi:hypothetical protein
MYIKCTVTQNSCSAIGLARIGDLNAYKAFWVLAYSKLQWAQVMLDESLQGLKRCGLRLPRPLAVADSWFSDAKLRDPIRNQHQGVFVVQGKSSYAFDLPDGRQIKGQDLLHAEVSRCTPASWQCHLWRRHLDRRGQRG